MVSCSLLLGIVFSPLVRPLSCRARLFIELMYFFALRQAIVLMLKQNTAIFVEFSTNAFFVFQTLLPFSFICVAPGEAIVVSCSFFFSVGDSDRDGVPEPGGGVAKGGEGGGFAI